MMPLGAQIEHFWLVQRMAKARGVDLVAAMAAGDLTQADWAQMITQCRGCTWGQGCAKWLDSHAGSSDQVSPGTCVNRIKFLKLKDKHAVRL